MIIHEGPYILYAECSSHEQAIMLANVRYQQGWEILSMPFPAKFELVDSGEERTVPVPVVWAFLMHRKH